MIYTIFDQLTGQILRVVQTTEIESQIQDNEGYLEGSIDDSAYYVENGQPVAIPSKPSQYADFDFSTKQWIQNEAIAIADALIKRKNLLNSSDWTQIPDNQLTTEQKALWSQYRQALRDITSQESYPFSVIWPTKP